MSGPTESSGQSWDEGGVEPRGPLESSIIRQVLELFESLDPVLVSCITESGESDDCVSSVQLTIGLRDQDAEATLRRMGYVKSPKSGAHGKTSS